MKFNTKAIEIWAKWLAGIVIGTVYGIGKFPLDLTAADWKQVANTLWLALVPVAIKWINPKDDFTMTVKPKVDKVNKVL